VRSSLPRSGPTTRPLRPPEEHLQIGRNARRHRCCVDLTKRGMFRPRKRCASDRGALLRPFWAA
jgi:hypothetical protein